MYQPDPSKLTVLTLPNCGACDRTVNFLHRHLEGDYDSHVEIVPLAETPEALTYVKEVLGHTAAPVVVVGDRDWSGYRPDLLREEVAGLRA